MTATVAPRVESPAALSWARWRALRRTRTSLLRTLMYEKLDTLAFDAPVLDVGGGRNADYAARLPVDGVYSANLSAAAGPSVITDVTAALPFRDGAFRCVIALNTFEHLEHDTETLRECARVLRPGGSLHCLTPFLWRVHGDPDDFHRHTASAWVGMLAACGLTDIVIEPLVWDAMSSAWAIADMAPLGRNWWRLRRFLRPLVLARPLLFGRVDKRQRDRADAITAEYALAYYAYARRPAPVDR